MRTIAALLAFLAAATPVLAQDGVTVEAGTALGVTLTSSSGTVTPVGIPGAGSFLGAATLYVSIFPIPALMIEPQLHLTVLSSDDETDSVVSGIGQVGYLFTSQQRGSPYLAAHGGVVHYSNGSNFTAGAFGAAGGYRLHIGRGGALRFEVRYRRWMESDIDLDEVSFALGVGGIFSH